MAQQQTEQQQIDTVHQTIGELIGGIDQTFGLRAFPEKRFRVATEKSFVSEGEVQIIVQIFDDKYPEYRWLDFSRGTTNELARELVRTAPAPAPEQPQHQYIGHLTIVEAIAHTVDAYQSCRASGNSEWEEKHRHTLLLLDEELPSGSGIDRGSRISIEDSRADRIVINIDFHHMNEAGYYDGWSAHQIIVTPSFIGRFDIRITGRDRNGIKEYLGDVYHHALGLTIDADMFTRIWPDHSSR